MKDDRNNWKGSVKREEVSGADHTKAGKTAERRSRFLRSLLELDGTTRINAELAEA
ncbi:MAG: hypothetical protein ACLVB1_05870 [Blautia obeum]